jgi:phosphatidylinositol-3-phosphatase
VTPASTYARRWWAPAAALVVAACAIGAIAVFGEQEDNLPVPTADPGPNAAVPAFSHVFVIVMENHDYDEIISSEAAPYLNELAARYGLATAYTGLFHPSQPNYIALFSGSGQGVDDNDNHDLAALSLIDQLEAEGLDWRVAAENVPSECFTGGFSDDGPDGPGTYARKHNPAISFVGIQSSPERCAKIIPLKAFDPGIAEFQFIVPNLCHDMHDCPITDGDRWLSSWVPGLLASPAWREGGVLFITFDEPQGGNADAPIPTFVISDAVPAGYRSSEPHTHYSLLRTIEDAFRLDCLENACSANTLGEFFVSP